MELSKLNSEQIKYVLFHLKQHVVLPDESDFVFLEDVNPIPDGITSKIIFILSTNTIISSRKVTHLNKEIPILFPVKNSEEFFTIDDKKNLIFNFDLLKASFYILSGYQEIKRDLELDHHNRFKYSNSIQYKFGCIGIPIVNYYFDIIINGFEQFFKLKGAKIKRYRLFDSFGFFLSHDVDRVEFHHIREVAYKLKQILGLAPLYYGKQTTIKLFFKGLFSKIYLNNIDPWWNFNKLISIEKELGIRSAFYFLKNRNIKQDSRYSINSKEIKALINQLVSNNFEVGVHGTYNSYNNQSFLSSEFDEFKAYTNHQPFGIRQHFLRFSTPNTFKYQSQAGFLYDTSLGFAEKEGFRNGYCYPFKPYDFISNKMLDIWEIPLNLMEATLLDYQNKEYSLIEEASSALINEVRKFGGIYSLLWHNCRLDENKYPGITEFYFALLASIVKEGESINGVQLLRKIQTNFLGEEIIKQV